MTEPTLALQRAIRTRLIANSAVTDLVPADHIKDGATRPTEFPSIIIGDGQTVLEGDQYASWRNVSAYLNIDVWTEEAGLESAKTIAGAITDAIGRALDVPGFLLSDGVHVIGTRFMRDPSGRNGHAVVSLSAFMGCAQ